MFEIKKVIKALLWIILIVIILFTGLILIKWFANMDNNKFDNETQTAHFKIYYNSVDEDAILDIENYLEDNYKRVTTDLKQELDNKVYINIYPDLEALHKSIQLDQGLFWWTAKVPEWVVGNTSTDTIKVVSPLADSGHTYDEILNVIVHELTHTVSFIINPNNKSFILSEGIAVYEAGQNLTIEELSDKFTDADLPNSIEEMFSWDTYHESSKLYAFGGSFVGFIVDNYGYDKFIEIYKKDYSNNQFDDDIKGIFENWIFEMETFCLT